MGKPCSGSTHPGWPGWDQCLSCAAPESTGAAGGDVPLLRSEGEASTLGSYQTSLPPRKSLTSLGLGELHGEIRLQLSTTA